MFNVKDRNFFPSDFVRFAKHPDSSATTLTTGDSLTLGATYIITTKPIGGTPSFDGCDLVENGVVFTATGTNAVWGTVVDGELKELLASGGTTERFNYYDKRGNIVMLWYNTYDEDENCIGWYITNVNNKIINQTDK